MNPNKMDLEMGHNCNDNCKRVAYVSFYKKTYKFEGCYMDDAFVYNVNYFAKSLITNTTNGMPLITWDTPEGEKYMDHTRFGSFPLTTRVEFVT
jgi:hypothetical protein